MKLISYNIYHGAYATRSKLIEFVRSEQPTVLCVQEANGWLDNDAAILREFSEAVSMPHVAFGNGDSPFKVVTLSQMPLHYTRTFEDSFHHSAVNTGILWGPRLIDIWNTHLNPYSESDRLKEAAKIIYEICDAEYALVVGDLNSLSSHDGYPDNLIENLKDIGIHKFSESYQYDGVLRYFENHGYHDAAVCLEAQAATVPTEANADVNHTYPFRLDYMLASKKLEPLISYYGVCKNDLTDQISDHYPIVVNIRG
jgi:endonuclease/exonuclease/phosphatase family metal-dependent hydrolase